MIWAALFFSVMAALVKATAGAVPTAQLVFWRSALPLPFLYVFMRRAGISFRPKNPWFVLLRAALGCVAMALSFYAVPRLHLSDAALLQQAQPIMVAAAAPFFLGERASAATLGSIATSIAGVLMILQPSIEVGNFAGVIMLLSAMASALGFLTVRRLSADDSPWMIIGAFYVLAAVLSAPLALADFTLPALLPGLAVAGVALTATLGQIFMTRAFAADAAPVVAAASYLSVVFGAVLGALFWGERPGPLSIAGAVLTVGSGIALVYLRRQGAAGAYAPRVP